MLPVAACVSEFGVRILIHVQGFWMMISKFGADCVGRMGAIGADLQLFLELLHHAFLECKFVSERLLRMICECCMDAVYGA